MNENTEKRELQICRLCLAKTITCISLINNVEAAAMLLAITGMSIQLNDEISTISCLKCCLNLKLAFIIQQNMLTSEQRYRHQLDANSARKEVPINKINQQAEAQNECDLLFEEIEIKEEKVEVSETLLEVIEKEKNVENDENIINFNNVIIKCCGVEISSKEMLKEHKAIGHVKVECPECSKKVFKGRLEFHMEQHICELCGKSFALKYFKKHMLYTHQDKKNVYKCKFCNETFNYLDSLQRHERREHIKITDFTCTTCGKGFYRQNDLKKHVQSTHLKLRPFICEYCKVGFSSKFAVNVHRRKHTNEMPFQCNICSDVFKHKVSLKGHLKSKHKIEEECTLECEECGKKFASKIALISHSRIH